MIRDMQAIILAAGKAKRFNSGKTKLLEKLCGQEIILYPLSVLDTLSIPTTLVTGFQADRIKQIVEAACPNKIVYVEQPEQHGTAHAAKFTKAHWTNSDILIMKADIPLLTADVIEQLYKQHKETGSAVTFVSAHNGDPSGSEYSQVIKTDKGVFIRTPQELSHETAQDHCCVNGGIYLFSRQYLEQYIDRVNRKEQTGEFHLSELVNIASRENQKVSVLSVPFDRVRGVSSFQELWAAEQIKRSELIKYWMTRGVRFSAAQSVHMDLDIEIGPGSIIGCSAHLLNGTVIGKNCTIGPFSILEHTNLGDNVRVEPHSILRHTTVGAKSIIGPFAHIQEKTTIGTQCDVGNFVEMKRSSIGDHTKAKHLSYLGDAQIGSYVNIGAGTITCNYDGKEKHTTHIKDYAFIGTNNSLVAPVTIEKKSFTAAGSVITHDVPELALAIARAKQVNKEGYAKKLHHQDATAPTTVQETKPPLLFVGAIKSHYNPPTTK